MEYYTCVIIGDFYSGNPADYVFGVRQDFRGDFSLMMIELEKKYECNLFLSQTSCKGHYWNFDTIEDTIVWLDELFSSL